MITKKVVYKKVGNRELSVDMFYTKSSQQKSDNSAIALFHGGGWVFGSPSEFYEACRRYARKGKVKISPFSARKTNLGASKQRENLFI